MTSRLFKDVSFVKERDKDIEVTDSLCTPPTPARPKRCYTRQAPRRSNIEVWVPANPLTGEPAGFQSIEIFETVTVTECDEATPAQPGVCTTTTRTITIPGELVPLEDNAWNASAIGSDRLNEDGEYRFNVDAGTFGLASGFTDRLAGSHYTSIIFGFVFYNSVWQVLDRGNRIASALPYDITDIFRVIRSQGNIFWYRNDQQLYSIPVPSNYDKRLSVKTVFYSANDAILDYCLQNYAAGQVPNTAVFAAGSGEQSTATAPVAQGEGNAIAVGNGYGASKAPVARSAGFSDTGTVNGIDFTIGNQVAANAPVASGAAYGDLTLVGQWGYQTSKAPIPITDYAGDSVAIEFSGQIIGIAPSAQQHPLVLSFGTSVLNGGQDGSNAPVAQGRASEGLYAEQQANAPVATGFAYENVYNYTNTSPLFNPILQSSASLDTTIAGVFTLEASLPTLRSIIEFEAFDNVSAELVGSIPPLKSSFNFGFELVGKLPLLRADFSGNNNRVRLVGSLPTLQGNLDFFNNNAFTLTGGIPTLKSNIEFGHTLTGKLPLLKVDFAFTYQENAVLQGKLPRLKSAFEFTTIIHSKLCINWQLCGGLPALRFNDSDSNAFNLAGSLPLLKSTFDFDIANVVAPTNIRTFVMNTTTGELTEYDQFTFTTIRQLFNKRYMVGTDGKLYRYNDRVTAERSANAYMETHLDNRVFNDRGELVPNQKIKRNYGAYIEMRTDEDAQVIVEATGNELETDRYILQDEILNYDGFDVVCVDFYRGPTAQYWKIGIRNTDEKPLDLMGLSQLIQILDRKIYS